MAGKNGAVQYREQTRDDAFFALQRALNDLDIVALMLRQAKRPGANVKDLMESAGKIVEDTQERLVRIAKHL